MLNPTSSPLAACLALLAAWGVVGLAGLLRPRSVEFAGRTLFPLGALCGLALAVVAVRSIALPPEQVQLLIGLPDLPFHMRLDPLAAVFLALLGAASAGISVFSAGYFRRGEGALPGLLCLEYHLFLASMGLVVLADDAYAFMVAWETMALSSYFLVTTQHRIPDIRRAGFLYLLIAHLGAIGILLSFGVMQGGSWLFTFDAMRAAQLDPQWASVAFLLAFFGFGAKAGLVPLHVWLPEAHPAAPSPVSALMSGVMLKTAVYGVLRVTFDLLGEPQWWWGLVALGFGLFSAFYGVVFAAVQTDMKRLLAWSSIENIGIIFAAIGITIVFHALGMSALAALSLIAALYHCVNHAFMKSLLFLGTGAVLHATGERNLGRLGGLIHRMPWVAWLTLVGALAIAGLPPLNGFVSEWLLLQAFLFADSVPRPFINMLLPIGAALVALCAALAGYVMVKFFGVIFLGQPREPTLAQAHDAGLLERIGLAWLAVACVVAGHIAGAGDRRTRRGEPGPARDAARPGGGTVVAAGTGPCPRRIVRPAGVAARGGHPHRPHRARRPRLLPPAGSARPGLGLRLRATRRAHAGHGRGVRPADPPHLPAVLPHVAGTADAVRRGAALPASRSRTGSGMRATSASAGPCAASRTWSPGCSRAASRRT